MKKSLIALAALTAFAGAASAQSSFVTIGGKLEMGVGKTIGSADKQMLDIAGSRLYFNIREDLGGGTGAIAFFETRFNPDDGTVASSAANVFWQGSSWVGVQGGFGRFIMGRMYTAAFTGFGSVQNNIDPFGGDTVGALRGIGMLIGGGGPAIGKVRNANAVRYDFNTGGFNFSFDIGEASKNNNTGLADFSNVNRPTSVSASYAAGPLFVGVAMENPGGRNDKLLNLGARYTVGGITLRGAVSDGTTNANVKAKGYLLGANMPLGSGDLRAGFAQAKLAGTTVNSKMSVGYKYDLSKRTYLYTDYTRDSKVAIQKTGYDFGLQHNF